MVNFRNGGMGGGAALDLDQGRGAYCQSGVTIRALGLKVEILEREAPISK
jgi:hypothetical protein